MGDPARYCIRDDYIENPVATTMDYVSGGEYWNASRVRAAKYFQYAVYLYVEELARSIGARNLVDVGCGVGTKLQLLHIRLPKLAICGIDQKNAIEYCRKHYDFGEWIVDDFENPEEMSWPRQPDILVCADVIEHVADPDRLLDYIRSIAGSNTRIVISTPERELMRGADCISCPHPQHVREWTSAEFQAYVKSRGFKVINSFLAPAYKLNLTPSFLSFELKRLLSGRPRYNNQVVDLQVG